MHLHLTLPRANSELGMEEVRSVQPTIHRVSSAQPTEWPRGSKRLGVLGVGDFFTTLLNGEP